MCNCDTEWHRLALHGVAILVTRQFLQMSFRAFGLPLVAQSHKVPRWAWPLGWLRRKHDLRLVVKFWCEQIYEILWHYILLLNGATQVADWVWVPTFQRRDCEVVHFLKLLDSCMLFQFCFVETLEFSFWKTFGFFTMVLITCLFWDNRQCTVWVVGLKKDLADLWWSWCWLASLLLALCLLACCLVGWYSEAIDTIDAIGSSDKISAKSLSKRCFRSSDCNGVSLLDNHWLNPSNVRTTASISRIRSWQTLAPRRPRLGSSVRTPPMAIIIWKMTQVHWITASLICDQLASGANDAIDSKTREVRQFKQSTAGPAKLTLATFRHNQWQMQWWEANLKTHSPSQCYSTALAKTRLCDYSAFFWQALQVIMTSYVSPVELSTIDWTCGQTELNSKFHLI